MRKLPGAFDGLIGDFFRRDHQVCVCAESRGQSDIGFDVGLFEADPACLGFAGDDCSIEDTEQVDLATRSVRELDVGAGNQERPVVFPAERGYGGSTRLVGQGGFGCLAG